MEEAIWREKRLARKRHWGQCLLPDDTNQSSSGTDVHEMLSEPSLRRNSPLRILRDNEAFLSGRTSWMPC